MKTTSLSQHVAALRLALLAALFILAAGPEARLARAAGTNWSDGPRDPKDPRFLAVPPELLPPAVAASRSGSAAPRATAIAQAAAPPATAAPAAPPPTLNPQPSTSYPVPAPSKQDAAIDAHVKGKTLYSFEVDQLELRTALAQFARANDLNIVPDNDVTGTVTLSLHDLPLEQVMRAMLDAADYSWQEEGGLIRVRTTETRTFSVDYLRMTRTGVGQSSALLASGSSTGSTTGGSQGGGSQGGGGGQGGSGGSQGGVGYGSSSINLTANNPVDFWKELKTELAALLSEPGRQSLAVNMTAGLIQITDRPSVLKKVERYLKGVDKSVHRQVDIDVKLYSVTLNNQFQFGIDWVHVAEAYGGVMGFGGSTLPSAIGGQQLQDSALGGLNRNIGDTTPGGNPATLVFKNFNTSAAVNALESQGKVEVISKPRVRTLNNQTALIKVGEDKPFFNTSTVVQQTGTGGPLTSENTIITSVTIGTILSLTPQISDDDWISLDISPVLTSLISTVYAPEVGGSTSGASTSGTTAPDLETKQASSLVRVRDGTTVVLGGLIQTTAAKNQTKVPLLGDIPYLGKLFTGTFEYKQKEELVIFVTPHIVREYEANAPPSPDELPAKRAQSVWPAAN
jgi:MSHA type pilus biogenesis protein MshL